MGGHSSKLTLEEQLRENKRQINRAIRELDRERMKLETAEKKLIIDIKNAAAKGQLSSAKLMTKDLVRTRRHMTKFFEMRSQLQGVNLRLQTVKSTQAMSTSMRNVAKVMVKMNQTLELPELQKALREFMKESEKLGLTEEIMGDAVDDVINDVDDEEEEEAVMMQVLEEIGVDISGQTASVPTTAIVAPGSPAVAQQAQSAAPVSRPVPVGAVSGTLGGATVNNASSAADKVQQTPTGGGGEGRVADSNDSRLSAMEQQLQDRLNRLKQ